MSSRKEENPILKDLNPQQRLAVTTIRGPLLIVAGAGSGKTRALTHRLCYLLQKGVAPDNIVALTFTNKAAREMKERIYSLLAASKDRAQERIPFIGTFHSFGAKMLRSEIGYLGRERNFVIYDQKDARALIKDMLSSRSVPSDRFSPGSVLGTISAAKNDLLDAASYLEQADNYYQRVVADVFTEYEQTLKRANAVDFDDLLILPVEILNKHPQVKERYQNIFEHILVDEYQDTNHAQYMFLQILAQKHQNLCVVGDDWQSIYMFRGADFRNILNFEKDYPNATVVLLEENYRSTQIILSAAQSIIEKNVWRTHKSLWTKQKGGQKINIIETQNEIDEGNFIVEEVTRLISKKLIGGLQGVAVLYRTNAQSRVIEEAFINAGLPYKIVGAVRFYDRREIKDIICFLRIIQNPKDIAALKRIYNVPPRGIGQAALDKILEGDLSNYNNKIHEFLNLMESFRAELKRPESKLSKIVENVIEKIPYKNYIDDRTPDGQSRWENVQELIGVTKSFDDKEAPEALRLFLEEVALIADMDEIEDGGGAANLITLHSAKGLEFPVVFIAGCEEGLLPHSKAMLNEQDLEEERRLAYVGITRAKNYAYLTFTRNRTIFGSTQTNLASRFLGDIPEDLIEFKKYSSNFSHEEGERVIEI